MKIRMLADNILVRSHEGSGVLESGLIIPESAREKMHKGTVVAVGEDVETLVPGEVVYHKPFPGPEVTINDAKYTVMALDRVLLVLMPEDEEEDETT